MENLIQMLDNIVDLAKILGPVGIVNWAVIHYFKDGNLKISQIFYSIIAPVIIPVIAVSLSEVVVNIFINSAHGDGLSGFIPSVILSLVCITTSFYFFYRRLLKLNGRQTMISISILIACSITMLFLLG